MIENWFSTPIYFNTCKNAEVIQELDNINFIQKDNPWKDKVATNFSLESDTFYLQTPCLNMLMKQEVNKYLNECNICAKVNIKESWYNVYDKGSYQGLHEHIFRDTSHISGVYYYKIPEGSKDEIDFNTPSPAHKFTSFPCNFSNSIYYRKVVYTPTEDFILLFPSFLEHSVPKIETEGTRISIAYNFTIEET